MESDLTIEQAAVVILNTDANIPYRVAALNLLRIARDFQETNSKLREQLRAAAPQFDESKMISALEHHLAKTIQTNEVLQSVVSKMQLYRNLDTAVSNFYKGKEETIDAALNRLESLHKAWLALHPEEHYDDAR